MPMKRVVAVLFAALAVAACSSNEEVATPVEPLKQLNNIVGKVNSVLISRLHVGGSDGAGFRYDCFPHGCGGTGQGFLFAPAEISRWLFEDGVAQERTIEGLELVESNPGDGDWRAYGAWMDHSAAFLSRYGAGGGSTGFFIASAFGSRSEEPLPVEGSVTWRGAMVGVDVVTADRYAGSANLVATFGEGQRMDVSFTDIANVETGASREDILFSDLANVGLYDGGQFFGHSGHDDFDRAPIYLDGSFFGPNHAEAAGVFGYNELIGAFGARMRE
ncbi:MAG: transferrin-binding protein-like solute binding protein [Acidimicrobiaceae bacterium]|nr:transferrin-binding protein-like solute binding protein [Acidimicrobiaceae bacterium]